MNNNEVKFILAMAKKSWMHMLCVNVQWVVNVVYRR